MNDQPITEKQYEHASKTHERNHQMHVDSRKAALDAANLAIRSIILVNGGAVVALLAFLSSLESNQADKFQMTSLVAPIEWFAWGVGFGITASALAYLINVVDSDLMAARQGTWTHPFYIDGRISIALTPIRFVLFWIAIFTAASSIFSFWQGVEAVTDAIAKFGG